MPAYGGSLFDPARFPWLTATTDEGMLAMTVSDRVMLHVLRSVQLAQLKAGEARQISFRDIDVEQIGYIYEGLLGYTATRVNETYVGLKGAAGAEPEIPLATLEKLHQENPDPKKLAAALQEWVTDDQPAAKGQSATAIAKGLNVEIDPSLVSALSQAVGGNSELRDRIKPFLGIIRQDLRSHPFVVLSGGLLLKETPSRKNAGAHYTPKSLAEEVVLHALQPLCYSPGPHQTGDETEWKLRPSEEILDLKVADIACGSGAFLVAAARYLADRIIEAWIGEDPDNAHRKDLHLRAIRQVVANCLYGADINEMAVEMAKLSLWLVSLDRDLPFSFVDDKIFLGNSLLGLTSLDQLRALHIDPANASGQDVLSDVDVDVDTVIRKAIELRERLASEIDEDDPMRSTTAKRRQYEQFQTATQELRTLADGVIAAGLPLGGKPGNTLDTAFQNLRQAVKKAQPQVVGGEEDTSWLESTIDKGLTPTVETDYERWEPLHWVLVAPDILIDHGGFDSIVGNPPFLGGKKISGAYGSNQREWLVEIIANGRKGEADLVSYFILRAIGLLRTSGCLGVIASESIAEGETRRVGLDVILATDVEVVRSVKRRKWPTAASVHVSLVWLSKSSLDSAAPRFCDGVPVRGVNSSLEPSSRVGGLPAVLAENRGLSFMGSILSGQGFVLTAEEACELTSLDPTSAEVIRPYVTGADVNAKPVPGPTDFVVDFGSRSLQEAEGFHGALNRVRTLVKPIRMETRKKVYRDRWWLFAERGRGLCGGLESVDSVLVLVLTSDTIMPVRLDSRAIFSNSLGVFLLDGLGHLAVMSSSLHQVWAMRWGSTLDAATRYTPSDVFESFPRPAITEALQKLDLQLQSVRSQAMLDRNIGLTHTYKLVNDRSVESKSNPDIGALRECHVAIDQAILHAYGWDDVAVNHGFFTYRGPERWTIAPQARQELLDRLLEENHRRAALEVESGTKVTKPGKKKRAAEQEEALF
jgi:methylase of polypeptide subunit release factors